MALCAAPRTTGNCVANNDVSGPDGVLTLPASGNKTQLWVGIWQQPGLGLGRVVGKPSAGSGRCDKSDLHR